MQPSSPPSVRWLSPNDRPPWICGRSMPPYARRAGMRSAAAKDHSHAGWDLVAGVEGPEVGLRVSFPSCDGLARDLGLVRRMREDTARHCLIAAINPCHLDEHPLIRVFPLDSRDSLGGTHGSPWWYEVHEHSTRLAAGSGRDV